MASYTALLLQMWTNSHQQKSSSSLTLMTTICSPWALHFHSFPILSILPLQPPENFPRASHDNWNKIQNPYMSWQMSPWWGPCLSPEVHPAPLVTLSLCSSHTDSLLLPQMFYPHFCLRAFAYDITSPRVSIPPTLNWPTPTHPLGLS